MLPGAIEALLDDLDRHATPEANLARLTRRIVSVVPELAHATKHRGRMRDSIYVARRLAELVVLGGMPIDELERVLRDVREMRRGEKGLRNAPGFLHCKLQQLEGRRWG